MHNLFRIRTVRIVGTITVLTFALGLGHSASTHRSTESVSPGGQVSQHGADATGQSSTSDGATGTSRRTTTSRAATVGGASTTSAPAHARHRSGTASHHATNPPATNPPSSQPTSPIGAPVGPPIGAQGGGASCARPNASVTVAGAQTSQFNPDTSPGERIVARGAIWTQVDPWPVSFTGASGLCLDGGRIIGTYPINTPWTTFHHTGALDFTNANFTSNNIYITNYGDGIRARAGANNWTIRAAHLAYLHDDCLENDRLGNGVVTDSLFDGCYVGLSARPSAGDTTSEGRHNTMRVDHSLIRLQPMMSVYKGPAPGTGGFFKWDDTGRAPKLALYDNIFRADQLPNHGSLGLPPGYQVSCGNNIIVWLGHGAYPNPLPSCFRVTTDRGVWDRAVAAWHSRHAN